MKAAIALGLLAGALAGAVAWLVVEPVWRASGYVQLRPVAVKALAAPAGTQPGGLREVVTLVDPKAFDTLTEREARRLAGMAESRATLAAAYEAAGLGSLDDAEHPWRRGVTVQTRVVNDAPGLIEIAAQADEAASARSRVQALVAAYRQEDPLAETAVMVDQQRKADAELAQLQQDRDDLHRQAERARATQDGIALETALAEARRELKAAKQRVAEVEQQLADFDDSPVDDRLDGPAAFALAMEDAAFARDLERWQSATATSDHPSFIDRLMGRPTPAPLPPDELEQLKAGLTGRLAQFRLIDGEAVSKEKLESRQQRYADLIARAEDAIESLRAQGVEAEKIAERAIDADRKLTEARTQRSAEIAALPPTGASVAWVETRPHAVLVRDHRAPAAVAAALTAGWGTLLLILLSALFRSRVDSREPETLTGRGAPLLVDVPRSDVSPKSSRRKSKKRDHRRPANGRPDNTADADDPASLGVHRLRAVVEAQLAPLSAAKSLMLIGAREEVGTTSLTVGLASSLAASGTRVLLVDLAGLARTDDRHSDRRPGEAKAVAAVGQRRLMHRALEDAAVLEREDADLLRDPASVPVGLPAMLDGATLRESLVPTRDGRLSLLPSALALPRHGPALSNRFLRSLTDQAKREGFDIIVIDGGGGASRAESLVTSAAVDGVVTVVPPGMEIRQLDDVLGRLRMVEANLLGVVLNDVGKGGTMPAETKRGTTTGSGIFAGALHGAIGDDIEMPKYPQQEALSSRRRQSERELTQSADELPSPEALLAQAAMPPEPSTAEESDAERKQRLAMLDAMELAAAERAALDERNAGDLDADDPWRDVGTKISSDVEAGESAESAESVETQTEPQNPSPREWPEILARIPANEEAEGLSALDPIVDQMIARATRKRTEAAELEPQDESAEDSESDEESSGSEEESNG